MNYLCEVRRACRLAVIGGLSALTLVACKGEPSPLAAAWNSPASTPAPIELLSGDVQALNYTPWYIDKFVIEGPSGSHIGGGGSNAMPVHDDGRPSESGSMCCTNFPSVWQADLKLTLRWLVDKKQDGKTPGYWYRAENVRIAPYGKQTYGVWAIFLPGDRVRVMVTDGNHDGGNNPNNRPTDNDPYIAQGMLDDEWNRLYRHGGEK
jgi:Protein of unknown function (DUF3304)